MFCFSLAATGLGKQLINVLASGNTASRGCMLYSSRRFLSQGSLHAQKTSKFFSQQQRTQQRTQCCATPPNDWSLEASGLEKHEHRKDVRLVLVNPQIPQNTGTIARTCAATAVELHLVGQLGFEIDSKKLKRAGLDYWPYVVVAVHPTWEDFMEFFSQQEGPQRLMAFSKKATRHYAAPGTYQHGDWLLFGAETTGLPDKVLDSVGESGGAVLKIPMKEEHVRSLNLAVSAGIGLYEAMRQLDEDYTI